MNTNFEQQPQIHNPETVQKNPEVKLESLNPYKNFKAIQETVKKDFKTEPTIKTETVKNAVEALKNPEEQNLSNLIATGKINALMKKAAENPALFEKALMGEVK